MKDTIAPHGGKLVNRIAEDKEREALEEKTPNFKSIAGKGRLKYH